MSEQLLSTLQQIVRLLIDRRLDPEALGRQRLDSWAGQSPGVDQQLSIGPAIVGDQLVSLEKSGPDS